MVKTTRNTLISRQTFKALLISLFFSLAHPLVISHAQSKPTSEATKDDFSLKPKITYREKAPYTEEARNNLTHGTVVLSVVFRMEGNISDIKVVRGLPDGLTESALEVVRKVRFEPGMKNGQPVSVRGTLEYTFDLYALDQKSIRLMLRNDFPLLSEEVVSNMATAIYKRGDRTTETAWLAGRQCFKQGEMKLPQAEQEELTNLMLEAIGGLTESTQGYHRELLEKSRKQQLGQVNERYITEACFSGMTKLSSDKRNRAEFLYNKAAAIGVSLL
jgi:TonB family protein